LNRRAKEEDVIDVSEKV